MLEVCFSAHPNIQYRAKKRTAAPIGSCDPLTLLPFFLHFRFLNLNDCILTHRDAAVLVASELYDYSVIGHIDNHAVEAAGCQNAVAYCYGCHQFCLFFLFLGLWTDCHKIEDGNDKYKVNDHSACAAHVVYFLL